MPESVDGWTEWLDSTHSAKPRCGCSSLDVLFPPSPILSEGEREGERSQSSRLFLAPGVRGRER